MINPTDFHKTAEFLKDQQEEWHVRTTMNRSYYGAFLYFRDFLTCQGVNVPPHKIKSQHQFVVECFEQSKTAAFQRSKSTKKKGEVEDKIDHKLLAKVFKQLQTLLQNRIFADYRLDLRFPPNYSIDCLRHAKETIANFDSLKDSSAEVLFINISYCHAESIIRSATQNR